MPCYDPPPTPAMLKMYREDARKRGDIRYLYNDTPRGALEAWLCDLMGVMEIYHSDMRLHPDLLEWWAWHKKLEGK